MEIPPTRLLTQLGFVAWCWAHIESLMVSVLISMSGGDSYELRTLLADTTAFWRLERLRVLASGPTYREAEVGRHLLEWVEAAEKVRTARNEAVHLTLTMLHGHPDHLEGVWIFGTGPPAATIRGKRGLQNQKWMPAAPHLDELATVIYPLHDQLVGIQGMLLKDPPRLHSADIRKMPVDQLVARLPLEVVADLVADHAPSAYSPAELAKHLPLEVAAKLPAELLAQLLAYLAQAASSTDSEVPGAGAELTAGVDHPGADSDAGGLVDQDE